MKILLYAFTAFISISLSLNLYSAVIDDNSTKVQKANISTLNQMLISDSCLRNHFFLFLFNSLNDEELQKIKKDIILSGSKELISHINLFFNDKIPSALKWRWFKLNKPITLDGDTSQIRALAISHNKTFIVIVSYDTAKICDKETGDLIKTLKGHNSSINSVAISHDDSFIVTGSDDKAAIIWDKETGQLLKTLEGHTDWIESVAISYDNTFIVTGSCDKTAKIWNKETGDLIHTLEGHNNSIESLAISYDDTFIVTGSYDYTSKIWDTKTGKLIKTLEGHTGPLKSVEINHDNKFIITRSYEAVKIWSIN